MIAVDQLNDRISVITVYRPDPATIAYYQAMTAAERAEDDEWSRLGEAAFAKA